MESADETTRRIIQEAHFAAVKDALDYLQDAAAITRRGRNGVIKEEARLVIATLNMEPAGRKTHNVIRTAW